MYMKTNCKIMMNLIIGIMMSLVISSCSKTEQDSQNVVGEWKISQLFMKYYENGTEVATVEEENFYEYFNFIFYSDGTLRAYFDDNVGESPNPITWKIEDGKMIFKEVLQDGKEYEYVLDIVELTKSSMILAMLHNEYDMQGVHYKSTLNIHFVKK